jgi:hypothetical protein
MVELRVRQMGRVIGDNLPLVLALTVAVAAVTPALAVRGIVATRAAGDSAFLLQRVQQMTVELGAGHFPPRWMPDSGYGLGYPFWNYYAPLAYLVAGLLAMLGGGVVGAIKVTTLVTYLAAAGGMFWLAYEAWGSRASGLLAAVAYTVAPYHLVNVYVRGDALAEVAAYACFPWVLLAVDRIRRRRTPDAVVALTVAFAALLVSHNISAMLFVPVLVAYVVWRLAEGRSSGDEVEASAGNQAGVGYQESEEGYQLSAVGYQPETEEARRAPQGVPADRVVGGEGKWIVPVVWTLRGLLNLERRWWPWRRHQRLLTGLAVLGGLVLGALLAMWFWGPAIAERNVVQLGQNLTGYFNYSNHFRGLDLVDLRPAFDYSLVGSGCRSCRIGLVQLVVAVLGVIVGLRLPRLRSTTAFWLVVALLAAFMITPLSRPVWGAPGVTSVLAFAQFPWRWLSILALGLAMLSGALGRLAWGWPLSLLAAGAMVLASLLALPVEILSVGPITVPTGITQVARDDIATQVTRGDVASEVTPDDITTFEVFSENIGTTVRAEYLPRVVVPRPWSSIDVVYGRPGQPRAVTGFLDHAILVRHQAENQEWQVDVSQGTTATLAFPTLWFPGWEAAVDDRPPQPVGFVAGSGWLTVDVPSGEHAVHLRLGRSGARAVAEGVSLLALLLVLAILVANRRRRWWRVVGIAVVVVALAAVTARLMPVARPLGPVTMDFVRQPFPHYNPGGIAYGRSRLITATVTKGLVKAEESIVVNLTWQSPVQGWQVETALVVPCEVNPGLDAPDVRAQVAQGQSEVGNLVLSVPRDTPDGLYFVRLRVLDGATAIQPQDLAGRELGTIYLGPVRIQGLDKFRDAPTSPVGRMGDMELQAVQPVQSGENLEVRMFWQANGTVARNYKTSVRLLDENGKTIAQDDNEPLYGFSPTTAWRAGQQIRDHRWLKIPLNTPPGDNYLVKVVLYDEISQQVIGEGTVSGVKVERW